MRKTPEKHTGFFNLLEAFQKSQECPLCSLESKATLFYLEILLYESVNDPGIRGKLDRSKGFCKHHSYLLSDFGDALGTSILYARQTMLFEQYLAHLKKGSPSSEKWAVESACPACICQTEARNNAVSNLIQWRTDNELLTAIKSSFPVCAPHILIILKTIDSLLIKPGISRKILNFLTRKNIRGLDDFRKYFIDVQQTKYIELNGELNLFVEKSDYHHIGEIMGTEGDAWIRAVHLMSGKRNIF